MTLSPLADLLSRKRLLVFDLDGTIVDSSPLHARAYDDAFAPFGVAVDYNRITGLTTESAVEKIAGEAGLQLSPERRARLIADKRARARQLIAEALVPMDGSMDFLKRAQGRYSLALCTSASRVGAEASLDKVGLTGWFEPLIAAEDVSRGKPDPECFLKALEFHGAAPGEALVFEDAESGLAAAAAGGIDAVHIAPVGEAKGAQVDWAMLNAALAEAHP